MAQKSAIRIEGINRLLAKLSNQSKNLINEELMGNIGEFIAFSINQRNAEGKDVEGKKFEPYSPKYRLFRIKHDHPVNIVNLFFSGSMASSLTHTAFKDKVEVYYMPTYGKTPSGKPSKVSDSSKAFFLNQKREFFGISAEEQATILSMVRDHLRRLLNER